MLWRRLAIIAVGSLVGAVALTAVRVPERPRALHEQPGYVECASDGELAQMLVDSQTAAVRASLRPDLDEVRDAAATRRFRTCRAASERVLNFLRQYESASQGSYASFPCAEEAILLDRYADASETDWPESGPWLSAIAQIRAMKRAEAEGFRRACATLMLRARVSLDLPEVNRRLPLDGTACRQELDVAKRYVEFDSKTMTRTLATAQRRLADGLRSEFDAAARAFAANRFALCTDAARRLNDRFRLLYAQGDL